jgi:hypothetical protein
MNPEHPIMLVVERNGEPIWEVRGNGVAVHDRCGQRALEVYRLQCLSRGIRLPQG